MPFSLFPGPGGVDIMEGEQAAANDFLCRAEDALQHVSLSLGGSVEPDQYRGNRDRPDDGNVKL